MTRDERSGKREISRPGVVDRSVGVRRWSVLLTILFICGCGSTATEGEAGRSADARGGEFEAVKRIIRREHSVLGVSIVDGSDLRLIIRDLDLVYDREHTTDAQRARIRELFAARIEPMIAEVIETCRDDAFAALSHIIIDVVGHERRGAEEGNDATLMLITVPPPALDEVVEAVGLDRDLVAAFAAAGYVTFDRFGLAD